MFSEILQNSQEHTCARVSSLIKLEVIKKETLAQVFSCEFCKISRNTFSYRTSPVAVSGDSERIYTLQFLNFLLETGTLSEVCVDSNFMEI